MTLMLHKGFFNPQNCAGGKILIQAWCYFLCLGRGDHYLCTQDLEKDSLLLGKLAYKSGPANTVSGFPVFCHSLLAFVWWPGICKAVPMRLLIALGRGRSPKLARRVSAVIWECALLRHPFTPLIVGTEQK